MRGAVALAALVAIGVALGHLLVDREGVAITNLPLAETPATLFAPRAPDGALATAKVPVVVIAHGFAGSQQLMQPFALTLARNGYNAVTFDFPGHGRNPRSMPGGLVNDEARTGSLLDSLDEVVKAARAVPTSDGRVALLGHSMAVEVLVRYAQTHPDIDATVGISGFAPTVTVRSPRNLLAIVGALEPPQLREEAVRVAGQPFGARTGRFAEGTAREARLAPGVEHIGVLYSATSQRAALGWIDATFDRHGGGFVDHRGPWLGMLFLGIVALAWPLARLLPVLVPGPRGAGLGWSRLLPVALLPALATPLILRQLPTAFLPILLGDYLAAHFALYGALTAAGWWLSRDQRRPVASQTSKSATILSVVAVTAYCIGAVGVPIDVFATSFVPNAPRVPLILAVAAGTLPYFLADEWVTRGPGAAMGGYAFTKVCFVLSLAIAIGLDVRRLFFLIIITPVIVLFFVIYGLFSTWVFGRTHQPLVAAVANALAFAWAIAVVFPLTDR